MLGGTRALIKELLRVVVHWKRIPSDLSQAPLSHYQNPEQVWENLDKEATPVAMINYVINTTFRWNLKCDKDNEGKHSDLRSAWQFAFFVKEWDVEGVKDLLAGHLFRYASVLGGTLQAYNHNAPTRVAPFVLSFPTFCYFVREKLISIIKRNATINRRKHDNPKGYNALMRSRFSLTPAPPCVV